MSTPEVPTEEPDPVGLGGVYREGMSQGSNCLLFSQLRALLWENKDPIQS